MRDHTAVSDDVCSVVNARSRDLAQHTVKRDLSSSSCCIPTTPSAELRGEGHSSSLGPPMPRMSGGLHALDWEDVLKQCSSDGLACGTPSLAHSGNNACWSADSNVQQALTMWAATDAPPAAAASEACTAPASVMLAMALPEQEGHGQQPQQPHHLVAPQQYQALAVQLPAAPRGPKSSLLLGQFSGSAEASPFFSGGAPSSSCSCRSEPGPLTQASYRDAPSARMGAFDVRSSSGANSSTRRAVEPSSLPVAAFASLALSSELGRGPAPAAGPRVPPTSPPPAAAAAGVTVAAAGAADFAAHSVCPALHPAPAAAVAAAGSEAGGAAEGTGAATLAESSHLPPTMARASWSMSQFLIQRRLYKSANSCVYQALDMRSGLPVALKVYYMAMLASFNRHQVLREVRLHASLDHPHIIQLYAAFQEQDVVVVVLEFAGGGDLYTLLRRVGGRLSEGQAVQLVLAPFLGALAYMHSRGYIHRDIKPENVLFTPDGTLKLADFGLAIDLNQERAVTRAGTLDYMAPEVLRCPLKRHPEENKGNRSLQCSVTMDSWATGVLVYELLVGFPPFASDDARDCMNKIMSCCVVFPKRMSAGARAFVEAALSAHPGDRPTAVEMLGDPWIVGCLQP